MNDFIFGARGVCLTSHRWSRGGVSQSDPAIRRYVVLRFRFFHSSWS